MKCICFGCGQVFKCTVVYVRSELFSRDEDAPKKISDPNAEMPDDWLEDEPKYIDDPDAAKPDDWDDEMDGEWEAPKVTFSYVSRERWILNRS